MPAVITAKQLVKKYQDFTAVNQINFTVQHGECFGILGPNGAGKSTTVRMIYCSAPVSSGELLVLGHDVRSAAREIKGKLGVVAQEDNLDPDLTVYQNLLLFANFFRIPKLEARKRCEELLAFFDLSHKAEQQVDKLSGGMKRRLSIARALVNQPELLILDEPTTGLDPQARHQVWQKLRTLKSEGVTLLLTTHYLDEASQLCDRLIIMDHGNILEEGNPQALVTKHIGREVLELGMDAEERTKALAILEGAEADWPLNGHLVVGEALFLFTNQGKELSQQLPMLLGSAGVSWTHLYLRPATLEDVFLKLTGKGLDSDEENT